MIGPSGAVRVMLATRLVDFRKGMDGLAMLVCEQLGADPFCGTVFCFRSKRADRFIVNGHPQSRLDEVMPWAYPTIPGLRAAAWAIRLSRALPRTAATRNVGSGHRL